MDQAAQSNQGEIAMRNLLLKKEQLAAYFNQHRLTNTLTTNQIDDNLINQIAINHQQVEQNQQQLNHSLNHQLNHQLNQQLNQQLNEQLNQQLNHRMNYPLSQQIAHLNTSKLNRHSPNRISPTHLSQQVKPILISNDQIDKEKVSGFNPFSTNRQLNDTQLKYSSPSNFKQPPLSDTTMQAPANRLQSSAFRPIPRRKDSVYSMDSLDSKRLNYDQQLVNLLNRSRTIEFIEPNQRVKSPKKNYIDKMMKVNGQVRPYTPTRLSSETPYKTSFHLANQFQQSLNHLPNSVPLSNSLNSLNHLTSMQNTSSSINYSSSNDDDDQLPLDMSKPNKTKLDSATADESVTKKTKLIKDADISQYINKIIAENSAIVETHDLKLSKRTSTRNSTSNLPSHLHQQQFKNNKNQLQRMNRSVSVIQPPQLQQPNYSELLNHDSPKLVSALRGQLENGQSSSKQPMNLEANSLLSSPLYSLYQNQQQQHQLTSAKLNRKLSDGSCLYSSASSKLDNLDSSFMKSFLPAKAPTIKVTPPYCSPGDETDTQLDNYSKSSIIKDLLLVKKDALQSNSDKNAYENDPQSDKRTDDQMKGDQEELSCLVYVCTICNIAFRNKETLNAHQTHYCKNNLTAQQSNKDLYSEVSRLAEINESIREDNRSKGMYCTNDFIRTTSI